MIYRNSYASRARRYQEGGAMPGEPMPQDEPMPGGPQGGPQGVDPMQIAQTAIQEMGPELAAAVAQAIMMILQGGGPQGGQPAGPQAPAPEEPIYSKRGGRLYRVR